MTMRRVEWIDIAKGFLILLVVFGHLNATKWFPKLDGTIKWIYTFHMMAFFMLSGMVFNAKNNFKLFFMHKCKTLLVPYVIFSALGLFGIVKQFLNNKDIIDFAANVGRTYLYGEGMWFLCSLFIVEVIAYFLAKIKKCKGLLLVGLILIGGGITNMSEWNSHLNVTCRYMQLQDFIQGCC